MFFITTTTLLTFLVLGMTKLTQSAKSEITYQSGWTFPNPLQIDQRTITLVADPKQYEIVASNYNGRNASDAQCQTMLSQGHFSGPCLTNVTNHNQVFNVHLISNVSNAVSVTFFANSSSSGNQAQIITAGNCFGGFTNEDVNVPLHQSGTSAIVGQGDRIGVLINCINNKRGPTLITNSNSSNSSNSSPSQQPTLLFPFILTFPIFLISLPI